MSFVYSIWKLLRPYQWIKNGFVFTGVLFANAWSNYPLLWNVILATIAFCLVSSCVYIFNDIIDREKDRFHPKKKFRPIAANLISIPVASGIAAALAIVGTSIGFHVSYTVFVILLCYLLLNIAYTFKLKHVVILDVFCIATGFMLRILAGTIGVGIPPSKWLLLCGLMTTLFMGFTKRRAEIIALTNNKEEHRKVLNMYGSLLLDEIIGICATGVIITYSLYTMSPETIRIHHTENLIYTVPFVIYALFRYIFLLHHRNQGEEPSRELLKDPHIMCAVGGWLGITLLIFLRNQ